jgi:hypothetical protein
LNPRLHRQKPTSNDFNYSKEHKRHRQEPSLCNASHKNKKGTKVYSMQTFVSNVILINENKPEDKDKATWPHSKTHFDFFSPPFQLVIYFRVYQKISSWEFMLSSTSSK